MDAEVAERLRAAPTSDPSVERLRTLALERTRLRKERQRVQSEIRREARRRKQTLQKVKGLTVEKLLAAARRAASTNE
jgi:hypothetical protein